MVKIYGERATYNYDAIKHYNYSRGAVWANPILRNKTFFPVNHGSAHGGKGFHWTLIVADSKAKTLTSYDSSRGCVDCTPFLRAVRRYIFQDQVVQKSMTQEEADREELNWKEVPYGACPQQRDGSSCGIFTILNAWYLSCSVPIPLTFSSADVREFRGIIGYSLLKQRIVDKNTMEVVDLLSPDTVKPSRAQANKEYALEEDKEVISKEELNKLRREHAELLHYKEKMESSKNKNAATVQIAKEDYENLMNEVQKYRELMKNT